MVQSQYDRAPSGSDALDLFFAAVDGLSQRELSVLERSPRALRAIDLETDPAFLGAVAGGRWTSRHHELALHAQRLSHARAADLTGWARRRALAAVLFGAALAVLNDAEREPPLPLALRDRLAGPWTRSVGLLPDVRPRPDLRPRLPV